MPPRSDKLELIPADQDGIVVGKVPVLGVGLRVGLLCAGKLVHMSPAAARRMAGHFETDEAKAVEMDWVAVALRECADELEAEGAVKH
jgi:hypothetical protein